MIRLKFYKIEGIMKNFSAGTNIQQIGYKSFQPDFINRNWVLEDMEIIQLLSEANRALGKLDMYSEYVPNTDLFIQMNVTKEATQSSRIEGTQTNMEEALLSKSDIPKEKLNDWEEVQNYIEAMNFAIERLETLPISSRLIKETHGILLQGVRGENKQPGNFRNSQNWIGGATLKDASFIPPVQHSVHDLMSDLEKFIHNDVNLLPELLKIALVHYQFETIHPFLDGNGRIGRLLITLYLVEKGILKRPVLYLSDFFEQHRMNYFDNLMRVRISGDLTQWFKFFLVGIVQTAEKAIQTFDNVLKLKVELDTEILKFGKRAVNIQLIMNFLYQHPTIDVIKVGELTGLSNASNYKIINELVAMNILEKRSSSGTYVFARYIELFG
jgi:Fic family protein